MIDALIFEKIPLIRTVAYGVIFRRLCTAAVWVGAVAFVLLMICFSMQFVAS